MDDFYVVGIGASAGGLEAVQQFFSSMTPVRNMAFVVIQHLQPDYKSYMPELLARHTEMPVHQIKSGMHIEPGCIYLNPPEYNVIIKKDHFELISQEPPPPDLMPEILIRYSSSSNTSLDGDSVDKLRERISELEEELRHTRESLRTSTEENSDVRRLLEEAMTFDSLKDDFFSNISHEIRTPLNVIMSTLQLLESQVRNSGDKPAGVDLKKHIGIIRQNCYRQLRLINNMIDINKMDSGFYEVKMQNQNIVDIVENITLSVSDYAKAKSIDLIFDTDIEEKIIACSPDSIERIMLNLLSNAVKFTEKGGSINVNMFDRHDQVQICVKDTGVGIPDGKLDIIFDRFRQVDKSLTRAHEGSGIGLSLVKSLVELHNGNISVNSKYGVGSEFIITLPVSTVPDDMGSSGIGEAASQQNNVERINLEFSDVYGVN